MVKESVEPLLDRAARFRAKAEENRTVAGGSMVPGTREAYFNMAKTQDALADQAEKLNRLKSGDASG
jgi:hypothetical protein